MQMEGVRVTLIRQANLGQERSGEQNRASHIM